MVAIAPVWRSLVCWRSCGAGVTFAPCPVEVVAGVVAFGATTGVAGPVDVVAGVVLP